MVLCCLPDGVASPLPQVHEVRAETFVVLLQIRDVQLLLIDVAQLVLGHRQLAVAPLPKPHHKAADDGTARGEQGADLRIQCH
jgi:hypothetical protein